MFLHCSETLIRYISDSCEAESYHFVVLWLSSSRTWNHMCIVSVELDAMASQFLRFGHEATHEFSHGQVWGLFGVVLRTLLFIFQGVKMHPAIDYKWGMGRLHASCAFPDTYIPCILVVR